jgi:tRNA modification GTPase
LPRVVFAGSANAGKSTLFNALLGRRRAVVSEVAGTTRDVLEEELDLSRDRGGAGRVMLVDVAGLDAAPGGLIEESAQLAAQRAIESADVILHCDPTARFAVGGKGWGASTIRVRTKSDLPGASDGNAIRVCALDGTNLATLKCAIADQACSARSAGLSSLLPRHRRAIAAAAARVGEAIDSFDSGSPRLANPELVADALRAGLDEIGELVGRISPDDVIGRVFATFCVGK